jgi:hypothetical protein
MQKGGFHLWISAFFMMFKLPSQNIMGKNNKLSGQPIICQLFSFIPDQLIKESVDQFKSGLYYKTMLTKNQLAFMLYGVITRCHSLNSLCKNLLFLEGKLSYIGIKRLPASSTLSDANINRGSEVFAHLYKALYEHYHHYLSDSYIKMFINGEVDPKKVRVFDGSIITLFVEVFKGAGRNPMNGKRKGGLKIQAQMPLSGFVPDFVSLGDAAVNDKKFLGQLNGSPGTIYVFDKGYVNYNVFEEWGRKGIYYVSRISENASYEVLECHSNDIIEYAGGGVIIDKIIQLKCKGGQLLRARLVTYKDPLTGKILGFLSNMFDYQAMTLVLLYKNRWNIEVLFKQLKQNFELCYFFSDSREGIKTQVWVALIANLLFTVIHKQVKECEQFTTMVSMAANNLGSYICFITLLKTRKLTDIERDIEKIQLDLFQNYKGGIFHKLEKSP